MINGSNGRLEVAARVAGFDDAIQARTGENVSIVGRLLHARLEPLLAAGLSGDERTRLAAEGAVMRDEEAFRLALGGAAA